MTGLLYRAQFDIASTHAPADRHKAPPWMEGALHKLMHLLHALTCSAMHSKAAAVASQQVPPALLSLVHLRAGIRLMTNVWESFLLPAEKAYRD